MKKAIVILGLMVIVVCSYILANKLFGTIEESFACRAKDGEVKITFVIANRDGSIKSCHACAADKCEIGTPQDCSSARMAVGFGVAFGVCRKL